MIYNEKMNHHLNQKDLNLHHIENTDTLILTISKMVLHLERCY